MNFKNLFLLTITSSAIAFSGVAFSADAEKSEPTGEVKAEKSQKPAKKKVKRHSHARDEKGMAVQDKPDGKSGAAETAKGVKPHNHMRDEKGIAVPAKPGNEQK